MQSKRRVFRGPFHLMRLGPDLSAAKRGAGGDGRSGARVATGRVLPGTPAGEGAGEGAGEAVGAIVATGAGTGAGALATKDEGDGEAGGEGENEGDGGVGLALIGLTEPLGEGGECNSSRWSAGWKAIWNAAIVALRAISLRSASMGGSSKWMV